MDKCQFRENLQLFWFVGKNNHQCSTYRRTCLAFYRALVCTRCQTFYKSNSQAKWIWWINKNHQKLVHVTHRKCIVNLLFECEISQNCMMCLVNFFNASIVYVKIFVWFIVQHFQVWQIQLEKADWCLHSKWKKNPKTINFHFFASQISKKFTFIRKIVTKNGINLKNFSIIKFLCFFHFQFERHKLNEGIFCVSLAWYRSCN